MRWGERQIPNNSDKCQVTKFAWIPLRVRLEDFGNKKVYGWLWLESYIAYQHASEGHWYLTERKLI